MRVNNQKLKRVELMRPDCLAGADIKDGARFLQVIREELGRLEHGHNLRAEGVTLGEEWALANIKKLIDCLE